MDQEKLSKDAFRGETGQGWIQRRNWARMDLEKKLRARMDLEKKLSKDGFREESEQGWI